MSEHITAEIEVLAQGSESCRQLMTVPGVGPIIASAATALPLQKGSTLRRARPDTDTEADVHG
jgi:hypothetical protein